MPAKNELSGTGLLNGLVVLWCKTLSEGVTDNGSGSFSRFSLNCSQEGANNAGFLIEVSTTTKNPVLAKLRGWFFSFFKDKNEWAYYSNKRILSEEAGDPDYAERDQKIREFLTALAKRQLQLIQQWDKVDNHYYQQRDDLAKLLAEIAPLETLEQLLQE